MAGQVMLELGDAEMEAESAASQSSKLQTSFLLSVILKGEASADLENRSAEELGVVIQTARRSLSRLQVVREGLGEEGAGLLQELVLGGELLLLAARLATARHLLLHPLPLFQGVSSLSQGHAPTAPWW